MCESWWGGVEIDLLLTDPPYNVNYQGKTKDEMTIENDNLESHQFYEFLKAAFNNAYTVMRPGAAFYVWYASREAVNFMNALADSGMPVHIDLIWVKNQLVLGRSDYQQKHEPCLYGWKDGASHYFIDIRSFTTVFDNLEDLNKEQLIGILKDIPTTTLYEKKPTVSDIHPTMKPVALFKKLIRNSSEEGDNVLDLFGGSGTTLIACEEMDRTCYMMEYDPKYADAILQRWEEATGQKAVLVNG